MLTRVARRRAVAGLAALALPLGILALSGSPAQAQPSPGSPLEVFIDTTASAAVSDAIQNGWWGHEGAANGTGTNTSFLDLDGSDPDLSAFTNLGNIRVAFVTSSNTGTAEHPAVTAGQTVDQVFGAGSWFMNSGLQSPLSGNTLPNDSVITVSTGAEFDAWFAAGQPVQGYDNALVSHDVTAPGNPVSAAPQGKSILNRWAAGQNISMVFYLSTGATSGGKPVVAVGPDGKAITAHMRFTTVARPSDATRSSAGYVNRDFGTPAVTTTTTLAATPASPQVVGTTISLDATVAAATGTATGSVQFFKGGTTSLGTAPVNGTGHAILSGVNLGAAGTYQLTATYTPTGNFATSSTTTPLTYQITAAPVIPTHIAPSATPGANYTVAVGLSATVTADDASCPAGSVVFSEGATAFSDPVTAGAGCVFTSSHVFGTPGTHTVTATFTPTGNYGISSATTPSFTLGVPAGVSTDEQTITGTIPAGAITITTPYTPTNPLDLGILALTPDLSRYTATAAFRQIHVLDTRAGALPWTLTALAGSLANGGNSINGQNVGLTNLQLDNSGGFVQQPGLGLITGTDNPAAVPPVAPGAPGNQGLGGVPHTVLSDTKGPADVQYQGSLTLNAPTTTSPGQYTGLVTFTAS